jgi:hypothetical protein
MRKHPKSLCKDCKRWKGGGPSSCPYAWIDYDGNCGGFIRRKTKEERSENARRRF